MDPATLIGIAVAMGGILGGAIMEGSNPAAIFLIPAMTLVFVGTFGACIAGGTLKDTIGVITYIKMALIPKVAKADESVEILVKLAEKARREGLLALEDAVRDVDDPFLKRGLELAVDGTDAHELREILESQVYAKKMADKNGAANFTGAGGYAPTIGIIGTVFGLIHVLENLSEPDKLGHLIAGAFVATLWGVMSANVFYLPMAAKIKRVSELECAKMELTIEGVLAIQSGANPRLVANKLKALLPPGAVKDEAADKAA